MAVMHCTSIAVAAVELVFRNYYSHKRKRLIKKIINQSRLEHCGHEHSTGWWVMSVKNQKMGRKCWEKTFSNLKVRERSSEGKKHLVPEAVKSGSSSASMWKFKVLLEWLHPVLFGNDSPQECNNHTE